MIAGAKQLVVAGIPDTERKIASQVFHARRAPHRIRMQNEFRVRSVWPDRAAGALQRRGPFRPAVQPRVCSNPKSPFEIRRLSFAQRFARSPQHRMTQPDRTIHPAIAGIWATVRQKIYERLQERPLYRRTVAVVDADNAAQSTHLSISTPAIVVRSNISPN